MLTLTEVESLAFQLPEQQRATLASRILDTVPPQFAETNDGIAGAGRRDAELDLNPGKGIKSASREEQCRKQTGIGHCGRQPKKPA